MMTDLCLSILKYSYATGQSSDNTIPWTHLAASNLFLIVKADKENDADLTMRVVQGSSVLESIDIGRLIDSSKQARRKAELAGFNPQVEQLPIFGMTRATALALRVRQPDGEARRVQFRMQSEADCLRVASAFESRGMEFQKQKPTKARQATPRPGTAMIDSRPSSMQMSSPFFQLSPSQTAKPDPFQRSTLEAGSLSSSRPMTSFRAANQSANHYEGSQHASQAMPPPKFFTRDESMMPREVEPTRPTTSHMYRSSTTPYHRSQNDQTDDNAMSSSSTVKRQVSASLMNDLDSIRQEAMDFEPASEFGFFDNANAISQENTAYGNAMSSTAQDQSADQGAIQPQTGIQHESFRPATSTFMEQEGYIQPGTAYGRPESRFGSNLSGSSRPTSSSLNLPPLPRPTSVQRDASPTKSNYAWNESRSDILLPPATASPQKRAFDVFAEPVNSGCGLTSESQTLVANNSPSKNSVSSTSTLSPTKPSPMDELLARKKPLLQRSANASVSRLNSLADAPGEIVSPPTTAVSPAKVSSTAARDNAAQYGPTADVNTQPTRMVASTVDIQEQESLNAYAAQSREDRATAMDDFIVANIENPAFATLCEDVENCWRRIALGL